MITNQLCFSFTLLGSSSSGFLTNRFNFLKSIMLLELMLLGCSLNFVSFSLHLDDFHGQIFALMILAVAACESSVGLALIISSFRIIGNIFINAIFINRF
jgi:NADH-quinone oxidoreductase subunit K